MPAKKSRSGKKKKSSSRTQRSSTRRERLNTGKATFFAKRTAQGRFKEMDEQGRSLKADRRTKAKRSVKSGHGDQGDRRQRAA